MVVSKGHGGDWMSVMVVPVVRIRCCMNDVVVVVLSSVGIYCCVCMDAYTIGLYVDARSSHAHALQSIGVGGFVYMVEVIYEMLYIQLLLVCVYIHWCR